jgi:hypothetical protein
MTGERATLIGVVRVEVPPQDAFALFTPTGERRWADGWSPEFPAAVEDETAPGTVFEVAHGGARSTWIVVSSTPGEKIAYARVTARDRAGLVAVECRAADNGMTDAHVSYTLTALGGQARASLAEFAARFPQFLKQWEVLIARSLAQRDDGPPPAVRHRSKLWP